MERNEETLSTRDLASPNQTAGAVRTPQDDMRAGAVADRQHAVDAQPPEEESRLPADEDAPLVTDERTTAPAGEQARLTEVDQTSPPAEAMTGVLAGDQPLEAGERDAGRASETGAPGHQAEDGPVNSTDAVSTQPQATGATPPSTSAAVSASDGDGSLLPAEMDAMFQQRWTEIQTRFVDEPRGAVEDADGLVANLMQHLAEGFAKERERLEAQWGRGEDISTEDLRVALQRYRTFFQRLLST